MKRILITLLFSVCTLLPAAVRTLFPSEKDWRLTGAERKDGMICIVNRSAGDYHSMGLWMKLRKGQKLTFKVVLRGENIAGKKKPYQGIRFFLWGRVDGKSTEFGVNHNLHGTFDWMTLTNTVTVPENFDGWLRVGLREVTGTLWVRELSVSEEFESQVNTAGKTPALLRAEQIDLGFLCIAKRKPDPYEYAQMAEKWNKLRSKLKNMNEADALRETGAFERFLMSLYQGYAGNSMSPNFYQWLRERRIERRDRELRARVADWRENAKALERFGLTVSPEPEIARMSGYDKNFPDTALVSSPEFDTAIGFFKEIAEERMRLGARLLAFDDELPVLERIAALRKLSGGVSQWKQHWKKLRSAWASAYNNGDFLTCSRLEKQAAVRREKLLAPLFAENGATPVIRPGASLYAIGVFGFKGSWHSLLNTNTRDTSLFADPGKEFQPYAGGNDEWNVSFDVTGAVPTGFVQNGGSWTHSMRTYSFRDLKSGRTFRVDSWWSGLAPGVLYDYHAPSVTISDNTFQRPAAPSALAAEIDGKVTLLRDSAKLEPARMTAKWLLLLWDNPAPKIPVLMVFHRLPERVRVTDRGLVVESGRDLGRIAVGTLYGAVPQSAKYGQEWTAVPEDEVRRIRTVARLLSYFPLEMEELFSVENGEICIRNRVTNAVVLDGKAAPYVPFPPLFSQAMLGRSPLKTETELSAPAMMTKFGPYRYAEKCELVYRIAAPDLLDRIPLKPSGEEQMLREYNDFVRVRSKNAEWRGTHMGDQSLGVLTGWLMMEPEVRKLLDVYQSPGQLDRVACGESFYHRARPNSSWLIPVYLIEPMTGRAAWFAGWRGFRHGFPMKGDMTMFNMALLQFPYAEAKYYGRWDLVERNWERLKEFYSAAELCQTWRAPGMNCTSSGFILSGDMFGDGFRMYSIMYRLALGMKDRELADRALYWAAKQTVTTTALIHRNISSLASHIRNTGGPEKAAGQIGGRIGIDNNGAYASSWRPYKPESWNAIFQLAGCTSYDYPFFGMLLRFLPEELRNLVDEMLREIPALDPAYVLSSSNSGTMGTRHCNAFNTLKVLAFSDRDRAKLRGLYRKNMPSVFSRTTAPAAVPAGEWEKYWGPYEFADWPVRVGTLPHLIAQNDPLWIGDYGRMRLLSGSWDRETRVAEIGLGAEMDDVLTFVSMARPLSVAVNGKEVRCERGKWGHDYRVKIPAGAAHVVVKLPPCDPERYPFPLKRPLVPLTVLPRAAAPSERPVIRMEKTVHKTGVCYPVDLSRYCNQALNDSLPGGKQDVWQFPKGTAAVCGVPFRFIDPEKNGGKGMIMLNGTQRPGYPVSVRIPVGDRSFRRIFFLHGTCYSVGTKALTYRLHFRDGQTRDLEICNGIQTGEWKVAPGRDGLGYVKAASPGEVYPAGRSGQWGRGVGGYVYVWENDVVAKGVTMQGINQQGFAKLSAIEIISGKQSVPIVLGITLEE